MSLELWGGIEPSICRVNDNYSNQLEKSGHLHRLDDLDKISKLGIKKIRYPVLWEMCDNDLSWAEERLNKLRELDIEPIVTLLHHGSGPKYTSLHDNKFSDLLSRYAERVAKKFPWVKYYTPVNEPVTTARFSALYGLWYPHASDNFIFGSCIINQCKGIIKSMEAIRNFNPDAVLVQTEDLGKTYSTPDLQYQADYDNERRWIGFDLLTGNINNSSLMFNYLKDLGFTDKDFDYFINNSSGATMLGLDSYLTSTRFLDSRIELYPKEMIGGNGIQSYIDTECIRVMKDGMPPLSDLLMEVWERYKLPLAITECHLNGNETERVSWFMQFWNSAQNAIERGADLKAVTSWGLLGLFDWDKLLTSPGIYEEGAFKIIDNELHETELALLLKNLSLNNNIDNKYLNNLPWWESNERLLYPAYP